MKSLKHSLFSLLATGVGALVLLGAVALGGNHWQAKSVAQAMVAKDLVADILPPPMYLVELRLVLGMALDGSLSPDAALAEHSRLAADYKDRVAYWQNAAPPGLRQHLLGEQHTVGEQFISASQAALKRLAASGSAGPRDELPPLHALYAKHRAAVDETVRVANTFATDALQRSEAAALRQMLALVALSAAATLSFVLLGLATLRGVMKATGGEPAEVARVANAVAEGDLTVQVPVAPGDQASVMAAMARMRLRLHDLVDEVRASSQAIASGSQQVASGSLDLSTRTEQQAASLQQTASVMEQFGGTLKNSATTAVQAHEVARTAQHAAQRGAAVMGQVVNTMSGISNGSRRIGEITALIDGIAFQTNILALNAAVEAARAGEQGRGFAVVAAEVRSLAQRSAAAAKEISQLIQQSVGEVDRGAQLVGEAGTTMGDIVQQVERVCGLIGEISSATGEQAQGIGVVSAAVCQLDGATQQNAALVEQSANASASLQERAEQLVQMVARFRLTRA